ncbi:cytochrome c peroxidase [Dyadobacter jejuensis]|uniref:Cytochrome c peroxidase n=1 Tax=Dyadobacter jejuensis TaxID=1082580 RepID=A0A316B0C2_9BACT|nr:cytochrome-c peroxidase [Dyadobacter jejuensis]PWJ55947.1 cytochrome c peroxidase [Dyadobacter jejuensis]
MNRFSFMSLGVLVFFLLACSQQKEEGLHAQFDRELSELIALNDQFLQTIRDESSLERYHNDFLQLRLSYKKVEAFAAYFTPTTVRLVNGAPLDEIEDSENAVFEPGGLQVIETYIYTDQPLEKKELIREVRKLQVHLKRIKALWKDTSITDTQVLDALRLSLFRLITLGISGFDTPASGNAIRESEVVLASFQSYLTAYSSVLPDVDGIKVLTDRALGYLKGQHDFNAFDRATFIVDYINPISKALHENQRQAQIPFMMTGSLLRGDAATLFEKGAFDPENLVLNDALKATPDRVLLGQTLFFDTRLSGNGQTSCGTCHRPDLAFTDRLKTSRGIDQLFIQRNAPTLLYASYQQALFYDLRSPSLEDQASDVIHNKKEMHGVMDHIVSLVKADPAYQKLYTKAYPEAKAVSDIHIKNALSTFVRSLGGFNSPFDAFMRGDKKALTDDQRAGFNLFMGKAQCGTCHFIPLFNGTVPPDYQNTESEVLGVTVDADWQHPRLDADRGRGAYNDFPQWQYAFKTPTIRNIDATGPYMHNGSYNSLQQVLEFYNQGGGAGLGLSVPNQTLSADQLDLTQDEMERVILFMEALSDVN